MTQDELKQQVAKSTMEYLAPKLSPDMVLGIGTGSTSNMFIQQLGEYRGFFRGAVASSEISARLLLEQGIDILDLNTLESLAFYIDGADECNEHLEMIKGGGAALTREKIVAAVAKQFICIVDKSKFVGILGTFPLPVEVIPMSRAHVTRELEMLGGEVIYREHCITDNGCDILDVHDLKITDARTLEKQINQIVGVVTNGLFAQRPADVLFLGTDDGVQITYSNMKYK